MERPARREPAPTAIGGLAVVRPAYVLAGSVVAGALLAVALTFDTTKAPATAPLPAEVVAVPTAGFEEDGPESARRAAVDDPLPGRGSHPLQHEVLAMDPPERNALFRLELADRALPCEDLTDSTGLREGLPVWRVACGGARAYLVEIDLAGRIVIEPQIYHEGPVTRRPGAAPGELPAGGTIEPDLQQRSPIDRLR